MSLLASELLKLRTIRGTYVMLGLTVLLAAVATAGFVGAGAVDAGESDRALRLAQAVGFGTLFATVVGILIVTSEYRHGTITTTFLGEPRRPRVLASKLGAAAIAGLVFALAGLVASALVALPWLSSRGDSLPLDGQALETVGRVVLAYVLTALVAAAVGAVVHSQVGALVGWFVWILVVESLITVVSGLLLTEFGEPDPISKFLPGSALGGILGGEGEEFLLDAGWAALLALGYAIALSALGALSMSRRDP